MPYKVVGGDVAHCMASAHFPRVRMSAKVILAEIWGSGGPVCLDMFAVSRWRPSHVMMTWCKVRI